jgi:hypothetical protein
VFENIFGEFTPKVAAIRLLTFLVGHLTRMGEKRKVYSVLVWRLGGKRQLRRSRHRWEYNNKMDLNK